MNHSYVDPHLRCIGQSFVVLAQPTAPAEPRECSFNHPSSRQHLKVVAVSRALHNLEHPACHGPDPLDQLSSIASIGPDQPHSGESPSQFIDDQLGSISILNIGRMHHHRKQQPHGIYNDVSLSTVDLLASVIATRPPFSVVFTDWLSMMAALGVGLPPLPNFGPQGMDSFVLSRLHSENTTTQYPKWEVMWHGSPRAAVAQNVQNAVDDLPQVYDAWPSPGLALAGRGSSSGRWECFAAHVQDFSHTP